MPDDKEHSLGRLAVQAGYLAESELEEVLLEQERRTAASPELRSPRLLGELMVELGFVAPRQIKRLLGAQAVAKARFTRVGPYELIAKLGEGGMGAVYQGRDLRTGELVAIKILPRSKARDPEFLARFEQEARAVFELDHPNVVKAVGLGEADGYHYLAMEYVEGSDVYDILEESGRIPEMDALSIAIQVTQGLEHSYEEQMVHRDIKPGNILVDRHGMAKLTDFGLALDRDRVGRGRITDGHEALGTPFYLSPEQARGDADVDIRSDIYSLGATLYEMVTGRPPFEGSPAEVLAKHLGQQIASPRDIDRTLSPGICHIIQKMMAKRRDDRYPTPRELLKDLILAYQGRDPVSERLPSDKSSVRASVRPVMRRHRRSRRHHYGTAPAAREPRRAVGTSRSEGPGGVHERSDPAHAGAETAPSGEPAAAGGGEHHPRERASLDRAAPRAAPGPLGPAGHGARRHLAAERYGARRDVPGGLVLGLGGVGVALLGFIAAALLFRPGPPAPERVRPSRAPPGTGILLKSDFENGSPEGWHGTVSRKGAGEGEYSLSAPPAAAPLTGLLTRLASGDVVTGRRVEIAFLYYFAGRGPIVVQFDYAAPGARDTLGATRFRRAISDPVREEWVPARLAGAGFTGPSGRFSGAAGGGRLRNVTICAPEASSRDVLALDAIWVWTDRAGAK